VAKNSSWNPLSNLLGVPGLFFLCALAGAGQEHRSISPRTETEAAKYRQRVASASGKLTIARFGRLIVNATRGRFWQSLRLWHPCVIRENGSFSASRTRQCVFGFWRHPAQFRHASESESGHATDA
jgi:hypothetical protein